MNKFCVIERSAVKVGSVVVMMSMDAPITLDVKRFAEAEELMLLRPALEKLELVSEIRESFLLQDVLL
jgi:hypothetical protein